MIYFPYVIAYRAKAGGIGGSVLACELQEALPWLNVLLASLSSNCWS